MVSNGIMLKRFAACAITALVVSGCASAPAPPAPQIPAIELEGPVTTPLGVAGSPQPEKTRDPLADAADFLARAATASPPQRQDWQLRAAAALVAAGQIDRAQAVLERIDLAGLPEVYPARRQLVEAEIALRQGRPQTALGLLRPLVSLQGVAPAFRAHAWQVRAQANLALGRKLDSVRDLIAREQYLVDEGHVLANQEQLWRILSGLNSLELQIAGQSSTDTAFNGWLDLALLQLDSGSDNYRFRQALSQWRQIYPQHSAWSFIARRLIEAQPGMPRIRRLALLLPLASRFGRAAQAVHDGFMAMDRVNGDPAKPVVVAYDVGEEPALAAVYYRLAVNEGADFVVGPLGKQAVGALIESGALQVPTLLLGSTPADAMLPAETYQFDLSPELEAEQTALKAYLDGHRIAAVLYPQTDWGTRVAQSFMLQWETLGGIVAESHPYAENGNDFSLPIKRLFNIDDSEARKNTLASRLGMKLEFEPRRRQDLDFVFLAAHPRDGRLIKPQINYYQGYDLTVYATSHVYVGDPDAINDADLNGVVFGDMPWVLIDDGRIRALRESTQADTHVPRGQLDRLFALGLDAYRIVDNLPRWRIDPYARLHGATADLVLAGNGRIDRQLTWARFEKGVPIVLDNMLKDDGIGIPGIDAENEGSTSSAARTLGRKQSM